LIELRMPAYGLDGPYKNYRYHDLLALDTVAYDDIVARGHVGRDFPNAHAAAGT
jgi:hypothetical protein